MQWRLFALELLREKKKECQGAAEAAILWRRNKIGKNTMLACPKVTEATYQLTLNKFSTSENSKKPDHEIL